MTQIPSGWYPDPDPAAASRSPGQQRWWDGAQWTEHVMGGGPVGGGPAPGAPYAAAYGPGYGPGYGVGPSERERTPDGQQVAHWWRRFGALVIDSLLLLVIRVVVGLVFFQPLYRAYRNYFREVVDSAGKSQPAPSRASLDQYSGDATTLAFVGVLLGLLYVVVFLVLLNATPGQLVLGMQVRRRDAPGRLPVGSVLLRWVGQSGVNVVGLVPTVGSGLMLLAYLYKLLNGLWPLWDSRRQTLHDKLSGTQVVLKSSLPTTPEPGSPSRSGQADYLPYRGYGQ